MTTAGKGLALPAVLLLGWISMAAMASTVIATNDINKPLPITVKNRHLQLLKWLELNPLPDVEHVHPVVPQEPIPSAEPRLNHLKSPRLVIVIDDLGNNQQSGERSVRLPGKVSMAILPFTPHAQQLANSAHQTGKEVLLHAPMENHKQLALGPGGLTLEMNQQQFTQQLQQSIDSVPNISGINNHMGSLMTEQSQQMAWTMDVLKEQRLFFLDSRTSAKSVALEAARESGVPHLGRTIFLDHERDPQKIAASFDQGILFAKKFGSAVLIGHPYSETLDLLEQRLPTLAEMGIQLVTVEQLIGQQRLAELQH